MPDSLRLTHVLLYVVNLQRSREFYEAVLGLESLHEDEHYMRLTGLGVDLGLHHAYEPEHVGGAGMELQLHVDDVDAWHARLSADGVVFTQEPRDMPWGARHAFFRDPDGYRLSIYSR
jgi:catechol 2,3-dioxygenase-like lactoylglutathione lyase family enzyme